jgi:hypothetical protein
MAKGLIALPSLSLSGCQNLQTVDGLEGLTALTDFQTAKACKASMRSKA